MQCTICSVHCLYCDTVFVVWLQAAPSTRAKTQRSRSTLASRTSSSRALKSKHFLTLLSHSCGAFCQIYREVFERLNKSYLFENTCSLKCMVTFATDVMWCWQTHEQVPANLPGHPARVLGYLDGSQVLVVRARPQRRGQVVVRAALRRPGIGKFWFVRPYEDPASVSSGSCGPRDAVYTVVMLFQWRLMVSL